jgi:hypothetical protein
MWKLLQRFSELDREARGLFLRGVVLLPLIAVSVRVRGFSETQAMLERFLRAPNCGSRPAENATAADVLRTASMVRAAARYGLARFTCLEKSLALWWLLGRQGIASSVRIGARKSVSGLEAHAWVEFEGRALNESAELREHYTVFDAAFPALSQK